MYIIIAGSPPCHSRVPSTSDNPNLAILEETSSTISSNAIIRFIEVLKKGIVKSGEKLRMDKQINILTCISSTFKN